MRDSTLPPAVRDAAMSTLSTLVTQTCFRTADGEFHGFEGSNDHSGCCFGNCTHVWNYETATRIFSQRSPARCAKPRSAIPMDDQGGMHFRQLLPDGKERFGYAAADGQMGQIIKAYLDWRLSGDTAWLRDLWPRISSAPSNSPGSRAAGTPAPTASWKACSTTPTMSNSTVPIRSAASTIWAPCAPPRKWPAPWAIRSAADYHKLFESGSKWIDANLFNGEYYYIQKVRGIPKDQIAPATVGDMGADDPETPELQLGEGCLLDQLMGQYLADVAGLGPLVDPANTCPRNPQIHLPIQLQAPDVRS
jgi:non-lysosomal glucosylceramidase